MRVVSAKALEQQQRKLGGMDDFTVRRSATEVEQLRERLRATTDEGGPQRGHDQVDGALALITWLEGGDPR